LRQGLLELREHIPDDRIPDKEREPVPVTSDAERPLPNAWRDVPGRPDPGNVEELDDVAGRATND
jgi:hypothetical protein